MLAQMQKCWHGGARWALLPVRVMLTFPKLRKLQVTSAGQLEACLALQEGGVTSIVSKDGAQHIGRPLRHMPLTFFGWESPAPNSTKESTACAAMAEEAEAECRGEDPQAHLNMVSQAVEEHEQQPEATRAHNAIIEISTDSGEDEPLCAAAVQGRCSAEDAETKKEGQGETPVEPAPSAGACRPERSACCAEGLTAAVAASEAGGELPSCEANMPHVRMPFTITTTTKLTPAKRKK